MIELSKQRELGFWESFNAMVHDKLDGHGNLGSLAKLHGQCSESIVYDIAAMLFNRHPMLRASIELNSKNKYIVRLNAKLIDVEINYITSHNENLAQQLYQACLRKTYDYSRSVWRLTYLQLENSSTGYLIFGLSHAIADGISIANLCLEFLRYANKALKNESLSPEVLPFYQAVEKGLKQEKFAARSQVILEQNEMETSERTGYYYHRKDPGLGQRQTGHVFRYIDKDDIAQLKIKCKKNHVTIHDALNAALLIALAKLNNAINVNVNLCSPINLRRFCDPIIPIDNVGCDVTMVQTQHLVDREKYNFWQIASDYHKKFRHMIRHAGNYPNYFNLTRDIMPYVDQCNDGQEKFFIDFGISNLGVINPQAHADDSLSLDSFYFSASRQGADCACLICACSLNNTVYLDFSFTTPMMSEKWIALLATKMCEEINISNEQY